MSGEPIRQTAQDILCIAKKGWPDQPVEVSHHVVVAPSPRAEKALHAAIPQVRLASRPAGQSSTTDR